MKRTQEQDVALCAAEINSLLPALVRKHTPMVVVAALTELVAHFMFRTQQSRECTPEQVRAIIERVRQITFAR